MSTLIATVAKAISAADTKNSESMEHYTALAVGAVAAMPQPAPTPAAQPQHNATSACEVCWHNAWVPTEEGLRCDYCWLNERYMAKSAGVDEGMRDRAADICAAIPKLSPETKGTLLRLITAEERDCMRAPMKILRADYQERIRAVRAELERL